MSLVCKTIRIFHLNVCAPGLALKLKHVATRKWAVIDLWLCPCSRCRPFYPIFQRELTGWNKHKRDTIPKMLIRKRRFCFFVVVAISPFSSLEVAILSVSAGESFSVADGNHCRDCVEVHDLWGFTLVEQPTNHARNQRDGEATLTSERTIREGIKTAFHCNACERKRRSNRRKHVRRRVLMTSTVSYDKKKKCYHGCAHCSHAFYKHPFVLLFLSTI